MKHSVIAFGHILLPRNSAIIPQAVNSHKQESSASIRSMTKSCRQQQTAMTDTDLDIELIHVLEKAANGLLILPSMQQHEFNVSSRQEC